jgi:hypothetical protein
MAKAKAKMAEPAEDNPAHVETSWRVPSGTTIKLGKEFHRNLWWLSRVTGEDPGKILERLCGVQVAASRKAREADIIRLRKLDEEEERLRTGRG